MAPKYLWMRVLLGAATTVALIVITGYLGYSILDKGADVVPAVMIALFGAGFQALILMAKDSNAFYYGTSQGSANKSETIDRMVNGVDPTPPVDEEG